MRLYSVHVASRCLICRVSIVENENAEKRPSQKDYETNLKKALRLCLSDEYVSEDCHVDYYDK